jgi:D-alanyl-D-alanine carboxypeptidase
MKPIHRRHFLTLLGVALLLPPVGSTRAQAVEQTVTLPARNTLPDPLLYRLVDVRHPIESDEIHTTIEPHLEPIPLQMDGILAANENVRVHSLCLPDLEALFEVSNQARTGLYIHSGFRSYEEQAYAYSHAKDKSTVLLPGTSQHHTGLALDFTSSEIGKIIDLYSGFERTKAGIWLSEHAWEYGFLQSYISNHDGIRNEPWHYLYVGRDLANIYRALKSAGWYGDVFILQTAIGLGMDRIVFDGLP